MIEQRKMQHSVASTNIADLLERVLDKGIVIAGDIKINLVEVELLTIQIRLVVCSVDKARELGLDWWANNPSLDKKPWLDSLTSIEKRISRLEESSDNQAGFAHRDGVAAQETVQAASGIGNENIKF